MDERRKHIGIEPVLSLLGGLVLFVYGIQMMSTSLETVAGGRMRRILERLTTNHFLGVLVEVGVTALIQSSSATTVTTVGFINSGLTTLKQAVWVTMDANVGTTITRQLIALDIGASAPFITFVGIMPLIFVKNKKVQHVGGIAAGVGVLSIGMGMMSDTMVPLRGSETFTHTVAKFSNPLLGTPIGTIFTVIIQSSSAPVGIPQALAMSGVIDLRSTVFVLFGQNTGTCITAPLASIGTNRNAKRITLIHLMFDVIGTTLFITPCILTPFTDFVVSLTPGDPVVQIANVHTIFNISTTLIFLPFDAFLEKIAIATLLNKTVPVRDASQWFERPMVSKHHFDISAIAINQIHDEIKGMLATTAKNVSQNFKTAEEGASEGIQAITDQEEGIDLSNMRLSQRISKILVLDQAPKDVDILNRTHTTLGGIERIGDHAMNLAEYAETIEARRLQFSNYVKRELAVVKEICREGVELLEMVVAGGTQSPLSEVTEIEQGIDDITRKLQWNQIDRIRKRSCNMESFILYSEMLTNYKRIGGRMLNIVRAYDAVGWSEDKEQTATAVV